MPHNSISYYGIAHLKFDFKYEIRMVVSSNGNLAIFDVVCDSLVTI